MEEVAYNQIKKTVIKNKKNFQSWCEYNEIKCSNINENNAEDKFNIYFKKLQKKLRKNNNYPDGIVIDLPFYTHLILVINDKNTFIYNNLASKKPKILENDIKYDYNQLVMSYEDLYRYNENIKHMKKVIKIEKINITKIKKISQILEYENLNLVQYENLEKYFIDHKFPNQLTNNIITNFIHGLSPKNLEILLKSGGKFFNPHYNSFDSERGIYTTLKTNECRVPEFYETRPYLLFSKQLANDLGYIFNFNYQYGILDKESIIKGQVFEKDGKKYSAIEYSTIKLCKKRVRNHEVVFFAEHIKLRDYLEAIVFTDKEQYQKFKSMKGIKFKNKMKLIKQT